ncbi:hypothetical protein M9458_038064, partial [Cirrhinus mrigala]
NSAQRASWNGFPWPSSCIQAIHHQVQCKASDAQFSRRVLWSDESCFFIWQSDGRV